MLPARGAPVIAYQLVNGVFSRSIGYFYQSSPTFSSSSSVGVRNKSKGRQIAYVIMGIIRICFTNSVLVMVSEMSSALLTVVKSWEVVNTAENKKKVNRVIGNALFIAN